MMVTSFYRFLSESRMPSGCAPMPIKETEDEAEELALDEAIRQKEMNQLTERALMTGQICQMTPEEMTQLPKADPILFQKMMTVLQLKPLFEAMPYEKQKALYGISVQFMTEQDHKDIQQMIRDKRVEKVR